MVPQQVACDRFPSSHYMVDPSLILQAVAICIYLLTIHFIHFSGPQVPSSWGLILIDFIHIWFANFHRVKWCCSVNINITSSGLERKKKEDISRYVILTVRFSVLLIICLGRCRELHHVDVSEHSSTVPSCQWLSIPSIERYRCTACAMALQLDKSSAPF